MTAAGRKRTDPRREATRTALIEAAESLFAEAGVDAVSTRQIGAAIGSANTNVVAYHFGSKDDLIREVYRYRLTGIDRRRGELLAEAENAGRNGDLEVLLRAFFQPLFEQTDSEGRHSYARFIAGLERSGMIATRARVNEEFPHSNRLSDCIRALLGLTEHLANVRIRLIAGLMSSALLQIDREALGDEGKAQQLFDNAIAMATAAMAARVGDPAPAAGQTRNSANSSD